MHAYENSADAAAARAEVAMRRLAHSPLDFTDPDSTYRVLGSLAAVLHALPQILAQLARWHEDNATRAATDIGDTVSGQHAVAEAAEHLRAAVVLAAQTTAQVDRAWSRNGVIAWHPTPTAIDRPRPHRASTPRAEGPSYRRRLPHRRELGQ